MTRHERDAADRDGLTVVRQISELLRSRPASGADEQALAVWFEQKATVFDAIAAHDPHAADECTEIAEQARLHARRLRGGGGS
jgi:hypothetical protein